LAVGIYKFGRKVRRHEIITLNWGHRAGIGIGTGIAAPSVEGIIYGGSAVWIPVRVAAWVRRRPCTIRASSRLFTAVCDKSQRQYQKRQKARYIHTEGLAYFWKQKKMSAMLGVSILRVKVDILISLQIHATVLES